MYGDADTMRVVNSVRGGFNKAWWYKGTNHLKDVYNLFSMTDEHDRKVLREKLAKGVSPLFVRAHPLPTSTDSNSTPVHLRQRHRPLRAPCR